MIFYQALSTTQTNRKHFSVRRYLIFICDGLNYSYFSVPCLWQLVAEYNRRLTEADIVEENIIQAQARAKAEEERALNVLKGDAGQDFHKMGLPPGGDSGNAVSPHYMCL